MAERLVEIRTRIDNMRQLDGVFTAMRGIAASRAEQARALVAGVDAHAAIAAHAIGHALKLLAGTPRETGRPSGGRRLMILFGAEQGFAGSHSLRVLDEAGLRAGDIVFVIGTRGRAAAVERDLDATWFSAMVTRADGVTGLADAIAEAVYDAVDRQGVSRVTVVFPTAAGAGIRVEKETLLPFDREQFGTAGDEVEPLTTLPPQVLIERLISEYVFARLCRAALRALEAENEARIRALSAARNNVGTKIDELTGLERRLRQEEITNELIEVSAGAKAYKGR